MGYQEFVVKIPKNGKETELFEKIRENMDTDCSELLNVVTTIKRNAPKYGLKTGDRFFVVTGDRYATHCSLKKAGCNFYPIDDVIKSCYTDLSAYGSVFQDTPYNKDVDEIKTVRCHYSYLADYCNKIGKEHIISITSCFGEQYGEHFFTIVYDTPGIELKDC